LTKEHRDQLWW